MLSVPQSFHDKANGQVISPRAGLYISYDKTLSGGVKFFTLDDSILDGVDILDSEDHDAIQLWDRYNYQDYTERLATINWSRSFEFPYTVQTALAEFSFDNYDDYFTPESGSAISADNLPSRPVRIYAGFEGETLIPQFVGITEDMPEINQQSKLAHYSAIDFLTQIANQGLRSVINMRDARTDEVLEQIVQQFGLTPTQYDFEQGENIIPFVFFNIGQNAGEAIRKLVQAEGGRMWLDEMGLLKFEARKVGDSDRQHDIVNVPRYSLMSIQPSGTEEIVNHIIIQTEVRELQPFEYVYTKTKAKDNSVSLDWVIPANSTVEKSCSLEDPCYQVVAPIIGQNAGVSYFTARKDDFTEVTSGVTATISLTNNSCIVEFTNSNAFAVEIDRLELYGEPAKVVNYVEIDAKENDSYSKYGDHALEITDNEFFQDTESADLYCRYLLFERAFYNTVIKAEIKGDFSAQLGDVITIIDDNYGGAYMIDSIEYSLEPAYLNTKIIGHHYVTPHYFTLDDSVLDGTDLLA